MGIEGDLVPPYAAVDVVERTGSTNADLRAAASAGAPDRTVLVALRQTAGVGRRQRAWSSPGGGLYCSVLLRPVGVPRAMLGTLTAVAGVALLRTVAGFGVPATLKWPNDLLLGRDGELGKGAGVLAEAVDGAVVLGIGLNIAPTAPDVPAGTGGLPATSLAEAGATGTEHAAVTVALLRELHGLEARWRAAGGDLAAAGLRDEYREGCGTLGRRVRVELVDSAVEGTATDVDATGALVLDGHRTVSAGDVVHLRSGD